MAEVGEVPTSQQAEGQKEQQTTKHPNLPKVDEFPEKTRPIAEDVYKKARTLADEIKEYEKDGSLIGRAREINEGISSQIGMPYGYYSMSQELASVIDDIQEIIARAGGLENPDEKLKLVAERLAHIQKNIANTEGENETFPSSHELLTHDVSFNIHVDENVDENHSKFSRDRLRNILETGILASRKYQIDTQGRSYANTGGKVIIGKDYVEYTEGGVVKRISKEKYAELDAEVRHKIGEPSREEHQLFFGSVGKAPDGGAGFDKWDPYFSNSISFVFSKPSLYAKSQFNDHGEIELYDRNYDSSNPDAPGFHVDLTREPMLIVVDEAVRDDFMEFIKGIDSPLWQDIGQDVWIQENVIFASTGNIVTEADKQREVYKRIEARFFERHKIEIPQGRFMPTGNTSGHRGWTSIYQPPL